MSDPKNTILVYGSYGYTGRLIVKQCRQKDLQVILAGRNREALAQQSADTGFPFEAVEIDNKQALEQLLQKVSVVIHCGGPFQFTASKMVHACLRTGTHYTDITGEYQVFEELQRYDDDARRSILTILPGVGFDVVPSDCLALHLKKRLPDATHLQLAFLNSAGGGLSRGTNKTMIEGLGRGSVIRTGGILTTVPLGAKTMHIDFGRISSHALNIPWGDIATAWCSTKIPNIEVYIGAKRSLIRNAKLSKYFNWILRHRSVKNYLLKKLDQKPDGPTEERRLKGTALLWGKAWNNNGQSVITRIEVPNGYTLTAITSVLIAEKILAGNFKPGFQTPATAYGADLILEVEGCVWRDEATLAKVKSY
ncbi:saccharopine dehydrogenase family protein [Pseudochryseolinea flava]|uniref:Saccharopine dehydrogenase n=1 Tax=Pseudochryseolinea flava TaxID=2059302 RepID=A0A364Y164_9BACT|nr:saccharopine dehydrogenase NADP-binding domain-containing protein [Pseudochryseolinea flava]RAW00341.1 saccharopine dehydrogenase [Pseudochryseolinea flava]